MSELKGRLRMIWVNSPAISDGELSLRVSKWLLQEAQQDGGQAHSLDCNVFRHCLAFQLLKEFGPRDTPPLRRLWETFIPVITKGKLGY